MNWLTSTFKAIKRFFYDGKLRRPRFRTILFVWGSIAVGSALFLTDPDKGSLSTMFFGLQIATVIIVVCLAHFCRKGVFDYPEADARNLFRQVQEGNVAAGVALVAIAIVFAALLFAFASAAHAADVRTYIPPAAKVYCPQMIAQQKEIWPDHPKNEYICAMVEHESCVSLSSKRCWSPTSQLKTAREEGAGFGQFTRAYRADGSIRFDALEEMRQKHPALRELTWENIYQRPELQQRAIILKQLGDYTYLRRMLSDPVEAAKMTDLAWNAGRGRVVNDRRACGMTKGCDPQVWFKNVELTCTASKKPIYGNRSACDISRHHVYDVTQVRAPKYAKLIAT